LKSSGLDDKPEIRRGMMLGEFRIVLLPTWSENAWVTRRGRQLLLAT